MELISPCRYIYAVSNVSTMAERFKFQTLALSPSLSFIISLSFSLSLCLSVYLSLSLSLSLSFSLSVCLFIYISLCLYITTMVRNNAGQKTTIILTRVGIRRRKGRRRRINKSRTYMKTSNALL